MKNAAWYKDWFNTPYYHKLYAGRDDEEASAFIGKLIQLLKPDAGSRMLDLACGRGRHSKILASYGYDVTGIDISPESIRHAKKAETSALSFYVHDMRLPFRSNYFDFTFNFFTSFGYFRTLREHDAAIRTVAAGLKKGGCFVLDYLNVHYTEAHLVPEESKLISGTTYSIRRWDDETHFYKKITVTDKRLDEPIIYTEKVAKFSLGDFTDMLSYQGMQVREVFGDYNFSHYDVQQSPRLILFARK